MLVDIYTGRLSGLKDNLVSHFHLVANLVLGSMREFVYDVDDPVFLNREHQYKYQRFHDLTINSSVNMDSVLENETSESKTLSWLALSWREHIQRMGENWLPKKILNYKPEGRRNIE